MGIDGLENLTNDEPDFDKLFHIFTEPKLRCNGCATCMDKNCPCGNKQRHLDNCSKGTK